MINKTPSLPRHIHAEIAKGTLKIPTSFKHGMIIGKYMDFSIFETLTDNHGVIRDFNGIALKNQLVKPGSVIIRPGLLYEVRNSSQACLPR